MEPLRATTKVRVRYKDTDCMQIVYYGNYLTYFEVGRVELVAGGKRPSEPDRFAVLDRRNVVIDQCVGHAVAAAAFRAARFQRR